MNAAASFAHTGTSFERRAQKRAARLHALYTHILHLAQPRFTIFITRGDLARAVGVSPSTLDLYLKEIARTKPWLTFRNAGQKGIAIFYRPDARKPIKLSTKPQPPTPPKKYISKNPINDPKGHADRCLHHPHRPHHRPSRLRLPRGKISSRDAWERRHWMKLWRRKSYKDPTLKWAAKNGADIVCIIGHFTWHAKVEFSTIRKAVAQFWNELLYAGKTLPAAGKALFQCLFVRLNAWIHKLTIKNVKNRQPLHHPPRQNIPQPAGAW